MIDSEIRNLLNNAISIGVVSHVRPDGDAVGAVLGLGLALINKGKNVQMVLKDGISNTFKHLESSELVQYAFSEECNLYIAVDCSDELRLGGALDGHPIHLVIDHHVTNDKYGETNLIEADAVATCQILAEHMPTWGLEITTPVAASLLTGILSDSIGFRTSNTNPKALRIAADLMEKGANISDLYNKALISRSFEAANYWGHALGKLERENGLVWTSMTLKDRRNSGYSGNDDADLTNVISAIDDLDIAVLFVEQGPDKTKISWRSRPGIDVSKIAISFGGGGHPAAAGAELRGTMEEVRRKVLTVTKEYLDKLYAGVNSNGEIRQNGVFR